MDCSPLGFPVLHYLLVFAQAYVHWVGDAIQLSHPLSPLLLLPSIFPRIRVFTNESALFIRWPKYWNFLLQHQFFPWIFSVKFLWEWPVWSPCRPRNSREYSPATSVFLCKPDESPIESISEPNSPMWFLCCVYLALCWLTQSWTRKIKVATFMKHQICTRWREFQIETDH